MRGPLLIAIFLAAGYVYLSGNGGVVSRHTPGLGQGGGAGAESYMRNSSRVATSMKTSAAGILK
jgi:hypothetical protein